MYCEPFYIHSISASNNHGRWNKSLAVYAVLHILGYAFLLLPDYYTFRRLMSFFEISFSTNLLHFSLISLAAEAAEALAAAEAAEAAAEALAAA